jgi:beta-lactamase regulating signal transducer with metallopeptidase domain/uncharacterized tellurite resistance protein B-like protein
MTTSMMLWALKGSVVLACGALVNLLLGKAPASLRHLVWTSSLTAVLALPALEAAGFGPRISIGAWWPSSRSAPPTAEPDGRRMPTPPASDESPSGPANLAQMPADNAAARPRPATADNATGRADRATATADLATGQADRATAAADKAMGPADRATATADKAMGPADRATATVDLATGQAAAARWPGGWPAAVVAVWLAGALALLGRTFASHVGALRLTRRDARPAPPGPRRLLQALAAEMGIRTDVRLVLADVPVPATWGLRGATVVLPAGHDAWPAATLKRVLLHELAHIQRRDCLTHLLGDVARALRWYDPLAWLAVHRQRVESERACDDRVLAGGATASSYAQDLLQLGRALRSRPALPPAALAMARTSRLGGRIGVILDARRPRGRVGRIAAAWVGTAALAVASGAAGLTPATQARPESTIAEVQEGSSNAPASQDGSPAVRPSQDDAPPVTASQDDLPVSRARIQVPPLPQSQELCVFRGQGGRSTNIHMDDDVVRIRWETDSCRVDIDLEGEVEFTSDDTGVARMADGALFEIEEREDGNERRVRFEGDAGGSIERRYWVDGDEAPWGPEADRWVAQVLPELFRHTTINAEPRVRRMLAEGGTARVLAEVDLMGSDHVAGTYLELLMELAELSEAELVRVIELVGQIESDHTSANLLLAVVEEAGLRPAFQDPLLRAAEGLDSDHEKGRVLGALLESPDLSPEQLDAVVRSAATIESDHGLSQVLASVARQGRLSAAGRAAFLDAIATIESDHNQGEVVDAFLDAGPLAADEVSIVLGLTRGIDSDHERATVLQRVASEYDLAGPQVISYLEAAREIDSDHQAGATAAAVIQRTSFSTEQLELVLSLAEGVESDHEMAGILDAVVRRRALNGAEIMRVVELTSLLDSDHQHATTLVLLAGEQELDGAAVLAVMEAAARIGSDHNQSEVLLAIAQRYPVEGPALERYRALAEGLSRSLRDRVLAALVR